MPLASAAAAAIVAALVAGIALFPHALDPGRAEESGIALNTLVDLGDATRPNDWFQGISNVESTDRATLRVVAGEGIGFGLVSRPLAVYPHERYAISFEVVSAGRDVVVAVRGRSLREHLVSIPLRPTTQRQVVRQVFTTGNEHRLSVTVDAPPSVVLEFGDVRLVRLSDS